MAKSLLSGLPVEARKKIRDEIKVAKRLVKEQEEQEFEKYWTSLNSLKKNIDGMVDKEKASGSVPKGTTLKRLVLMPKDKPKRWSSVFKRIFGRKTKKVATKNKKAAKPKSNTPKKKTAKSAGAMATTLEVLTPQQRCEKKYEANRKTNQALIDRKNEARRLRRANGNNN